eukprot:TRINITY_DN104021_c0_g1_i1.p1 TRINITY_DN104021_c0_g1~~TRINITY_DN104021_c0_g1_i1.p1  ORF type:complete len:468 (+),score=100.34 TRINITY_DN104021_c0_g1_i1:77-1480(+)
MEEWDIDTINQYCNEHFGNAFECILSETKGRIMIANKAIRQGELLFEEPPLHIVSEDKDNKAFQLVKKLCKDEPGTFDYEPLWYWTALCSLTEEDLRPKPKIGSLKPVPKLTQKRLLCLFHEPVEEASDAVQRLVKDLGLSTPAVLVEELLQAWILNCFEHSEDPLGYSAYFASSFVSHSCGANGIWSEGDDGLHILRARRDIAKGDEVCISYLPEDVLLHSAAERKKSLKSTKQFDCMCERCAAQPPDKVGRDLCRGFRCPRCNACGVFHQLIDTEQGLQGAVCRECQTPVSAADAQRLLKEEDALEDQIKKLDAASEKRHVGKVLNPDLERRLLNMLGNSEAGCVGPQHWLCERLWEHLESWHKQAGRWEKEMQMLSNRTDYQRRAYQPGPSGTLAWTLEHQADRMMELLEQADMPAKARQEIAPRLLPILEESATILRLMFGADHEYHTSVHNKKEKAERLRKQ